MNSWEEVGGGGIGKAGDEEEVEVDKEAGSDTDADVDGEDDESSEMTTGAIELESTGVVVKGELNASTMLFLLSTPVPSPPLSLNISLFFN